MASHSTKQQYDLIGKPKFEIYSNPSFSSWTWMISILFPHRQIKGLQNGKVLPRCGRKKGFKWFSHFYPSPFVVVLFFTFYFYFALLVCFAFMFWVNLVLCIALFNIFLFVYLQFWFFFSNNKKNEKSEKYKNSVCFCTLVLVYLVA